MSLLAPSHLACIATFSKPRKGAVHTRVVVSGVRHADGWHVRVERFTAKQAFTDAAMPPLEDVNTVLEPFLNEGWGQVLIQTPTEDIQILQSMKGADLRRTMKRRPPSRTRWDDVGVDRAKPRLLRPETDAALLHALDLATEDGRVKAPMADKYRQINHLLGRIINDCGEATSVRILDLGCGKAYLSLALMHVLRTAGVEASLHGVDSNPHVVAHCTEVAQRLGMDTAHFTCARISDVTPEPADVVLALHACDTATDEALSCALSCNATWMYIAPCCHHAVQVQLKRATVPEWARPLLDDGITRERLGDLLTDTMRRDALRARGYDAHLEEFIALEHTQKNILLRAVRTSMPEQDRARWAASVHAMATAWGVVPRSLGLLSSP
jgi:SAM-dependent methyltransferase